jgi:hypothetical protein
MTFLVLRSTRITASNRDMDGAKDVDPDWYGDPIVLLQLPTLAEFALLALALLQLAATALWFGDEGSVILPRDISVHVSLLFYLCWKLELEDMCSWCSGMHKHIRTDTCALHRDP